MYQQELETNEYKSISYDGPQLNTASKAENGKEKTIYLKVDIGVNYLNQRNTERKMAKTISGVRNKLDQSIAMDQKV